MGSRKNRKRRLKRKERQAEKATSPPPVRAEGTQVRHNFSGKARKGDVAEVKLEFSGVPVSVDDPDKDDLEAKTRVQTVLQERLEQEGRRDH